MHVQAVALAIACQMSEARALYNVGNAYHAKAKYLLREERTATAMATASCSCNGAAVGGESALDLNSNVELASPSSSSPLHVASNAAHSLLHAGDACFTPADSLNSTADCPLPLPNESLAHVHSPLLLRASTSTSAAAGTTEQLPRRHAARLCLLAAAKYYE